MGLPGEAIGGLQNSSRLSKPNLSSSGSREGAGGVSQLHRRRSCIEASGCLGQCGNGPMVLVLPETVWYGAVQPKEVPAVIDRHLRQGQPVRSMLYRKFHAQ
jgi:(2Fe-2S) ferredoxin